MRDVVDFNDTRDDQVTEAKLDHMKIICILQSLTTKTASGSNQPFCHNTPSGHTDTDRQKG